MTRTKDSTLDALYRQVESLSDLDTPDEVMDVLLVLADYMEERGDQPKADCLRWCRKHGKRPWRSRGPTHDYHWYNEEEVNQELATDPASDLPRNLFSHLKGVNTTYRVYKEKNHAAWTDLLSAWVGAVAQGWDPNSYVPRTHSEEE